MSDISSEIDKLLISLAGAVRKETLALGTADPSYEVQPIFSPAKQAILHLIQSQKEELIARFEEIIGEEPQYKDGLMIFTPDGEREVISPSSVRNKLRQTQRQALKELL